MIIPLILTQLTQIFLELSVLFTTWSAYYLLGQFHSTFASSFRSISSDQNASIFENSKKIISGEDGGFARPGDDAGVPDSDWSRLQRPGEICFNLFSCKLLSFLISAHSYISCSDFFYHISVI